MKASVTQKRHNPPSSSSVRRLQKRDKTTEEMTQEGIIDSLTAAKAIFAKYHPDSMVDKQPQRTNSVVENRFRHTQSQRPLKNPGLQRPAPKSSNNSPYIIKTPPANVGIKKTPTLAKSNGLQAKQFSKTESKKRVKSETQHLNGLPIAPKQIKTHNALSTPQKTIPVKKTAKQQFIASPRLKSLSQAQSPSALSKSPASNLISRHSSGHNSIRSVRTVSTNGTLTKTPVFASPNASPSVKSNNSSMATIRSNSIKPSQKPSQKPKPLTIGSPPTKVQKKPIAHTHPVDTSRSNEKDHGNNLFSNFSSSSDNYTPSTASSSQRFSDSDTSFIQHKKAGSGSLKPKREEKHRTLTRKLNTKNTLDEANSGHHTTTKHKSRNTYESTQSSTPESFSSDVGAAVAASKALYTLPGYDSMNSSVEPSKKDKVHHHGLRSKLFNFRRDPKMRNSLDSNNFGDTFSISSAAQPKNLNMDHARKSKRHSLDLYRAGSMTSQRPNDSTLSFPKPSTSFGSFSQNRESKIHQLQKKIEEEKKPEHKTVNMRTVAKINLLADEIARKTIESSKNDSHEGVNKTNLSLKMPSATSSPKKTISTSPSFNGDTTMLSPLSIPDTPLAGFASRNGSKSSLLQNFRPNTSQPSQAEAHLLNNFVPHLNSFSQTNNTSSFYGTKNLKRIPPPPSSMASSQSLASSFDHLSPSAPGSVRSSFDMNNYSSESLANLEPALTIKKNGESDKAGNLMGSNDQISYNEDSELNSIMHSQYDHPNIDEENSDVVSFVKSDKSNNTLENFPQEKKGLEFVENERDSEVKSSSAIFGRAMRSLTNFSLHSDSKDERARADDHEKRNRTGTAVSNAATIVVPQHAGRSADSSPPSPQTVQPPQSSASSIVSSEKKKSFGPFASLIRRVSSGHHGTADKNGPKSEEAEQQQLPAPVQSNSHNYQYEKQIPHYQQVPQTKILTTLREDKPKRSKKEKLKKAFMLSGHSGQQKHAKNSENDSNQKRGSSRDQAMSLDNNTGEHGRKDSANGNGSDEDDDDDDDEYDYLYYKTNQAMPHRLYRYKDDDDEDEVYKKKKMHLKSLIKTPAKFTYDSIKKSTNKLNDMTALNHNQSHNKVNNSDNLSQLEEAAENESPSRSETFDQSEQASDNILQSPAVSTSGDASDNFEDTYSTLAGDFDESNTSSRLSLDGTPAKNTFNDSFVMPVGTSHPDMEMYMVRGRGGNKKIKNKAFDADKPWKNHVDLGYITPQEKKRYEGIWVSNRNSYLSLLPPSWKSQYENEVIEEGDEDVILNILVYEIWSRSHLSPKLLRQIYNMVDLYKDGLLRRRSFIVGMWLIDQCLYGKKLPPKVDDRVWQSVDKIIIGVNIDAKSFAKKKKKYIRKQLKDLKKQEKQHNQKLMLARQGKKA